MEDRAKHTCNANVRALCEPLSLAASGWRSNEVVAEALSAILPPPENIY